MLFKQTRIGKKGVPFTIYKLRSIPKGASVPSVWGSFLRRTKIDELPQLLNILKGEMTLVGPRPDVPGYADQLRGDDRLFLKLKPGLTGLASLKYRKEEQLLAKQSNPIQYNDTIIWPDKVRINNWYAKNHSFKMDLQLVFFTVFFFLDFDVERFMKAFD
jgi:lipopolysaccharide/colanic/teichoic acid biosynthesis glycosyltransferase